MKASAKKIGIFIIDDNLNNIVLLEKILLDLNYSVRVAIKGYSALKSIQQDQPDLILLDYKMPDLNGYEICEKLRDNQQTKRIPIIFISALDGIEDKIKALDTDGIDYMTKPFLIDELCARIQALISFKNM